MGPSRKPRQVKAGRTQRGTRRPGRKGRLAKGLAFLFATILVVGLGAYLFLAFAGDESSGPKKAAIVDQLSLTQPNPAFAETATGILEDAGYLVDYYPGEAVTVEFYRDLPTHGYDLILRSP